MFAIRADFFLRLSGRSASKYCKHGYFHLQLPLKVQTRFLVWVETKQRRIAEANGAEVYEPDMYLYTSMLLSNTEQERADPWHNVSGTTPSSLLSVAQEPQSLGLCNKPSQAARSKLTVVLEYEARLSLNRDLMFSL